MFIYVLLCPITGAVRYVGKTSQSLEQRHRQHLKEARLTKTGLRGEWLRSLIVQGLKPIIEHDCDIRDDDDWQEVERRRIAYYLSIGCDLVNGTAGGEGLHKPTEAVLVSMRKPHVVSLEGLEVLRQNAKIGQAANRGAKRSQESRARMSAAQTGKKQSAETIAKRTAAMKAVERTEEWRANISAALKGKTYDPHTDEHRAKISESLRVHYATNEAPPKTEEQRAKISKGLKRYFAANPKPPPEPAEPKPSMRGKWPRSAETRAKTRAALLGKKHSPERRAAQSAGHTGKKRGPRSAEVRAKINAGHKARINGQGDLSI